MNLLKFITFLIIPFLGTCQEKFYLPFNTKEEIYNILKYENDTVLNLKDFQIVDTIKNQTLYFADGFLTKCTINQNCLKFEQFINIENDLTIKFLTSYLILNKEYYNFFSFFDVNYDTNLLINSSERHFLFFLKNFQDAELNEFLKYGYTKKDDNNFAFLAYYLYRMNFLIKNKNSKYILNTIKKKSFSFYNSQD